VAQDQLGLWFAASDFGCIHRYASAMEFSC
jgi:hypothetical protein